MFNRFVLIMLFGIYSMPIFATWSIVVFDTHTQEVGVGSATCLSNEQVPGIDLLSELAVIVVGEGGGAAQSALDASAERRMIMDSGIRNGMTSEQIIAQLEVLSGNEINQEGVAGAGNSSDTFSGTGTFQHASGVANNAGTLYYAIQGNVLAGMEVVTMTEQTLINTAGDLAAKMMAAMETARDFGGDGRCSCPGGPNADSCGSPPASI